VPPSRCLPIEMMIGTPSATSPLARKPGEREAPLRYGNWPGKQDNAKFTPCKSQWLWVATSGALSGGSPCQKAPCAVWDDWLLIAKSNQGSLDCSMIRGTWGPLVSHMGTRGPQVHPLRSMIAESDTKPCAFRSKRMVLYHFRRSWHRSCTEGASRRPNTAGALPPFAPWSPFGCEKPRWARLFAPKRRSWSTRERPSRGAGPTATDSGDPALCQVTQCSEQWLGTRCAGFFRMVARAVDCPQVRPARVATTCQRWISLPDWDRNITILQSSDVWLLLAILRKPRYYDLAI